MALVCTDPVRSQFKDKFISKVSHGGKGDGSWVVD
jgi:hypothetical protein